MDLGRSLPRLAASLALLVLVPLSLAAAPPEAPSGEPPERPRVRELGLEPGILPPGPGNAITDVTGVVVGHRTLVRGDDIRTGVTAVLPHGGNLFQEKVPAAVHVVNGFGKAAGFLQVEELGTLETPIVLTNTLAVGTAVQEVVRWTLAQPGNEEVRSVNAVVGETNDGFLNDIRALAVTAEDVREAIEAARASSPDAPRRRVSEGSVGAGTGTRALGWKGGIGTASRRLPESLGGWTVGALVQSNFGGVLTIDGVPVGEALGRYSFREHLPKPLAPQEEAPATDSPKRLAPRKAPPALGSPKRLAPPHLAASAGDSGDGSCMIVLATDAPLSVRDLERLARRAGLGLARVGSFVSHGSGDFVVAFSTARRIPYTSDDDVAVVEELRSDAASPLFLAAVEAVEEAILNSLLRATTVTGHRGTVEAIPVEVVRELVVERRE